MKKVFLFLVCLFALQTVVMADDDKPIQVNQLPQPAQTFIKQYFSAAKVPSTSSIITTIHNAVNIPTLRAITPTRASHR